VAFIKLVTMAPKFKKRVTWPRPRHF